MSKVTITVTTTGTPNAEAFARHILKTLNKREKPTPTKET